MRSVQGTSGVAIQTGDRADAVGEVGYMTNCPSRQQRKWVSWLAVLRSIYWPAAADALADPEF
jgi:hypothetical protein